MRADGCTTRRVHARRRVRLAGTMLAGLLLATLLPGCTALPSLPTPRAAPWTVPVQHDGRVLHLPLPAGVDEVCAGDRARLAEASAAASASVALLACLQGRAAGPLAGYSGQITALAAGGRVDDAQFDRYKASIREAVGALQAALARGQEPALAGAGRVLRILDEGEHWVVHAVLRPRAGSGAQAGVVTSALVDGQLLYMTLLRDGTSGLDWARLARDGREWARAVIQGNLFRVPDA